MAHKLLISTLLVSHFIASPLPLLASSEDGLSPPEKNATYWLQRLKEASLSKEEYLEAAQCLGQDPDQGNSAADAFCQYFTHAPTNLENTDLAPEAHSIYEDALRVFCALRSSEKFMHRDTYSNVLRWHLNDPDITPKLLLTFMDEFRFLGFPDEARKTSQRYVAHPDKSATDKAHLFKAARAHDLAGQTSRASILYSLAIRQTPQDLSPDNMREAAQHFMTAGNHIKRLEAYKQLFAQFGANSFLAVDFLNAAECAVQAHDNKKALDFLTSYFDYEMDEPSPLAYRLRATCATLDLDFETAKEYWLLAIKSGATMFFADYAKAAHTFNDLGDLHRAATYWKKAFSIHDMEPDYLSCASACLVFFQICDYENGLTPANGVLASEHL